MNILFILTDQQNRYALGCMGNPNVETPNLDLLAKKGSLFRRCYANDPICGPSRGNLMTGQYSSRSGVTKNGSALPLGTMTLADAYNKAGYQTSWVGKWHLGGNGNEIIEKEKRGGYKRFMGYQSYNGYLDNVCFYDHNNHEHRFNYHRTEATTDIALKELDIMAENDAPFLLTMSYQAPHYPEEPLPKFEAMYENKNIIRRENSQDIDPYTETYNPQSPQPISSDPNYQKYGNDLDEYLRQYYAMCTQIDDNIGRLISKLKELKIDENTAIFFTSDHGDMQGSHGLKNKCLPHEESSGIPCIVYVPNEPVNIISDELISMVDMMPTCLDISGLPAVVSSDGNSFASIIRNKSSDDKRKVYSERIASPNQPAWVMLVKDNWKLVVSTKNDSLIPQIFINLKDDPFEYKNLINDSRYEFEMKILLSELENWKKQVQIN